MKRNSRTVLLLTAILVAPLLASAIASRWKRSGTTSQASALSPTDSDDARRLPPVIPPLISTRPTPIAFESFNVQNRKSIADLQSRLGADAFAAMLRINRKDRGHLRVGDLLIIPTSAAPMSAAPFPLQLEAARNTPKLILVSRRVQAFGAYESGRLVRWGPTSTGKKSTPTPAGLYHTNWKAKKKRSSVNASWILPWCFNLDDHSGVSFHQFELPGYPASHGCVRLLEEDAKWIYDWADQWTLSKIDQSVLAFGTPVVIFGDYTYGEKPAWTRLAEDPGATVIATAEIDTTLNRHLSTIEARTRARQQLTTSQGFSLTSGPKRN